MPGEGFYIDHVIYGCLDVDATAARLRRDHGLGSVPGGVHLGGTTNRLVPLAPPTFLELLGVGDAGKADGAWLAAALSDGDRPLWWAIGVDDLDDTARRRGLAVQSGAMEMADGSEALFRTAGMPRYPLPFFIEYAGTPAVRMRTWQDRYRAADHDCEPGEFTFVEVGGPPELIEGWLGEHDMPVRHGGHTLGIRRAGIATDGAEVRIG
ncbi:MAG: VOC family protein [Thermoleophilia bacterium]